MSGFSGTSGFLHSVMDLQTAFDEVLPVASAQYASVNTVSIRGLYDAKG
jgi:hypothetical protein